MNFGLFEIVGRSGAATTGAGAGDGDFGSLFLMSERTMCTTGTPFLPTSLVADVEGLTVCK